MCPLNNIINNKKYKHLTEIERYKIEAYLKDKKKAWQIAELLGKSERTIQREIKRGTVILLNSKFLVYFLNFPVFTGFHAHQHLCNFHFSLIFSLVRKL